MTRKGEKKMADKRKWQSAEAKAASESVNSLVEAFWAFSNAPSEQSSASVRRAAFRELDKAVVAAVLEYWKKVRGN